MRHPPEHQLITVAGLLMKLSKELQLAAIIRSFILTAILAILVRKFFLNHHLSISQPKAMSQKQKFYGLWKTSLSHYSYNSAQALTKIVEEMFPNSDICLQMRLGSTKISYSVTFGLAPYFCSNFLACFDEAFNRV